MEFKNSDRLNHCISNTNNTRKYRAPSAGYFDKVDRLSHDRYRHVRRRGLPLRKYSIPRFHFGLLAPYFRYVSLCPQKCYYKSPPPPPFFANQFTSSRESWHHRGERERKGEREKGMRGPARSVAKMENRKKSPCTPGALPRDAKDLIFFFRARVLCCFSRENSSKRIRIALHRYQQRCIAEIMHASVFVVNYF